jgi:predicted nucleic acid-binding protein
MKCFIDSDVVLDLLTRREPFFEAALPFFRSIEVGEATAAVASLTFSNAHFVMRRTMTSAEARSRLDKLRSLVEILSVDEKHVRKAIRSSFSDFEDAIQHECAVTHKMDCLVTRDTKDYKLAEIPVYSPVDALKIIRSR